MKLTLHLALGLLLTTLHCFVAQAQTVVLAQQFDGVTAPNLPAGWSNAASGSPGWSTTGSSSDSPPNSAFASDPAGSSDSTLTSPSIAIGTTNAQLTFRHQYNLETGWDGGVLEISINGGAFNDVPGAGGSFLSGGYNGSLNPSENPIAGRNAWTGNSGAFITTVVKLPSSVAGQNVKLRWRLGSDGSFGLTGWHVDTISVTDQSGLSPVAPQIVDTRGVDNNIVFSFSTVPGQTYITEFKNLLTTNALWLPLQTHTGDGLKKSVTNSTSAASQRYFRVRTQ